MRIEPQIWIEPWSFVFGWRLLSGWWLVIHFGPVCIGIGRIG